MIARKAFTASRLHVENNLADPELLTSHGRVTDIYLLAPARANNGKLATMDPKLAAAIIDDSKSTVALV